MLRVSAGRLAVLLLAVWTTTAITGRFSTDAQESASAGEFNVQATYDKVENQIAMRDGVRLSTVVYSPKDKSRDYPLLLKRTPYSAGPYGQDRYASAARLAPSDDFLRDGYIFVLQDVRGTFNSEGEWVNLRPIRDNQNGIDETTDTFDTIDWLVQNIAGNNGRVGQWGISHPGWYTVMGLVKPHPALKAASPQATTFDAFTGDDDHHNGAFNLAGVEWWYMMSVITGPDRRTLNGEAPEGIDLGPWDYEFFLNAGPTDRLNERYFGGRLTHIWDDIIEHPDYDEFWTSRNAGRYIQTVDIPVLNVGGWFDSSDPYGTLATYDAIEAKNPINKNTLVMGPWRHGGWLSDDGSQLGDQQFGSKTSEYFKKDIIFPFFQHYLKGKGDWTPAEATVFETGGNRWHRLSQWPPQGLTDVDLYFERNGRLSFEAPIDESQDAYDSYVSDPSKPVPYTAQVRASWEYEYMIGDQRHASTRPDVLTYQTEVLEEDVTVAGQIPVELYVSTSGTDSDWFVKLIDVYPDRAAQEPDDPTAVNMAGYQVLLSVGVMRGKYRNSFSSPEPMEPGKTTVVAFNLWDKFHTFKKGHRIMVQVHSSWFPIFDRNPQIFTNIYRAQPDQFQKATQRVYRSARSPSHLVLPVWKSPRGVAGDRR